MRILRDMECEGIVGAEPIIATMLTINGMCEIGAGMIFILCFRIADAEAYEALAMGIVGVLLVGDGILNLIRVDSNAV